MLTVYRYVSPGALGGFLLAGSVERPTAASIRTQYNEARSVDFIFTRSSKATWFQLHGRSVERGLSGLQGLSASQLVFMLVTRCIVSTTLHLLASLYPVLAAASIG
jgi:hypothetical protein